MIFLIVIYKIDKFLVINPWMSESGYPGFENLQDDVFDCYLQNRWIFSA